jgi:flagellar hook-basal body complex protein FliE
MAMDVTQVRSLLEQAQQSAKGKAGGAGDGSPVKTFADLLSQTSKEQQSAQTAFERYAAEGQGELHDVMGQIAKADVAFRFLLEVRNKLTEAYQEISRIPV